MFRLGWHLGTLVVVANADSALAAQTVGPEAAKLDVSLGHSPMLNQKPDAEDGLSEDVEDCVSDDLATDVNMAATISDTPDTVQASAV